MILTGHEHSPETADVTRNDHTRSIISGGVLQDNDDPRTSSFITIRLDLDRKARSTVTFRYSEAGFYERINPSDAKDFAGNLARLGRPFELQESHLAELDNIRFVVHHPQKQFLNLSDVFVYPDLLIVDEPTTTSTRR